MLEAENQFQERELELQNLVNVLKDKLEQQGEVVRKLSCNQKDNQEGYIIEHLKTIQKLQKKLQQMKEEQGELEGKRAIVNLERE